MHSNEIKNDLITRLLADCIKHLEHMKRDLSNQSVFAYTIYCSTGYESMGVAACTREWLDARKQSSSVAEQSWYAEVNAAEWGYVNKHYDLFSDVDEITEQYYEIIDDGEFEDIDLDALTNDELLNFSRSFFTDIFIKVLSSLKKEGYFNTEIFERDLMLGISFGDPDENNLDLIEHVSRALNSEKWHNKILMNLDLLKQ